LKTEAPNVENQRNLGDLLADGIAVALSWILNPLIVPGAVYGILLFQFGATWGGIFHGTGIGLLLFALIPGLGIIWLRIRGDIDSFDIRTKEKRVKPMLLGLACNVIALVVVLRADFPGQSLILASTIAFFVVGLDVFIVTKFWKISIHLSTYGAIVAALIISTEWWIQSIGVWPETLYGPFGIRAVSDPVVFAIIIGALMLMWARIRCKVHSFAQVSVGLFAGLAFHLSAYLFLSYWLS